MQGKYILSALVVILLVCSPVAASTSKIAAGAPVFIGETNLDITSAIDDCHVIAWWPAGADMSTPPAINLTVRTLSQAGGLINHFNVSPQIFTGHTGAWYCEDKAPFQQVLFVVTPQFTIRAWNLDNNTDISGQSVPLATNVTYRIDSNLYQYADYYNRTNLNPSDTIFTVNMMDPMGRNVANIYTGNAGAATTQITPFDSNPFITAPVYFGKNLNNWNRLSRDAQGGLIYPPGTYIITASQDLGGMQEAFAAAGITDLDGMTTGTTSVTFVAPVTPSPTVTPQQSVSPVVSSNTTSPETQPVTTLPTARPVTSKTPYQPLPEWIAVAGLLIALICFARQRT
ncbi:DUF3821 domain-containing protein [Methanoregula sp.]|uniref:DUF3821 domain-containing protein n=1 Tax=Methanoregula sp. TaxID=2052170 RepID=UPI003C7771B4